MSRTATAEMCAQRTPLDQFLDRQAILTARECGQFQPGRLAAAFGWHPSNGSRAMNGDANGGRWFPNFFGGLYRLATHPQTQAWPALARGRIVVQRSEIAGAPTQALRKDFWMHMDARRAAEREAADAMEANDARRFAEAEARRGSEAEAVAAHLGELLDRNVNPLQEGRPA